MKPLGEDERRKYFRIIDEIDVSYKRYDPDATAEESEQLVSGCFDEINKSIFSEIKNLKVTHPESALLFELINKKIDRLMAVSELENTDLQFTMSSLDEVSISACGLAFPANEKLEADVVIELNLFLHASEQRVIIKGQVVGCQNIDAESEEKYCVRVEFIDVDEMTRENLIQYMMQRQRYLLKNLSEELYQGFGTD